MRRTFRSLWLELNNTLSATIIAICLTVFLCGGLIEFTGIHSRNQILYQFGLSYYGLVRDYRLYQLVTSPFFHANLEHLVFNMLSLWFLGPRLERAIGRSSYVVLSAVSSLAASIGFLAFDAGRGSVAMGYSGVIFGLLTAHAVMWPDQPIIVMFFFNMKMKYAALIWGGTELYFSLAGSGDGIAHSAHLCGIIGAGLYLYWIKRSRTLKPEQRGAILTGRAEIPPEADTRPASLINTGIPARAASHLAASQYVLIHKNRRDVGKRIVLGTKAVTIGRSESADVTISGDEKMSRIHAKITPSNSGRRIIEDVASKHGTYVNGTQVSRCELKPGDRIQIGHTKLQYSVESDE